MPEQQVLTPEMLIAAYSHGIFPMAQSRFGEIAWYRPDPRAILPLHRFQITRSLASTIRKERLHVTIDQEFGNVIRACADRNETWISGQIISAYEGLAAMGFAHSIETRIDGQLVGGLYGVALGGAFFGESMFHTARDASKVALVALVKRLQNRGFLLLDTQYATPHLEQFGLVKVSAQRYSELLDHALDTDVNW